MCLPLALSRKLSVFWSESHAASPDLSKLCPTTTRVTVTCLANYGAPGAPAPLLDLAALSAKIQLRIHDSTKIVCWEI